MLVGLALLINSRPSSGHVHAPTPEETEPVKPESKTKAKAQRI